MEKLLKNSIGLYLNTAAWFIPNTVAKQSFTIFCHPRRQEFKSHHNDFLNTAFRFKINFNDLKIQGYKWGTGSKKILYLHGWQSHAFHWKNYVKQLPVEQFTQYALDAPGHGASEGDTMHLEMYSNLTESFIQEYGPFDAIVTHSMGGLCILYTLFKNPDLHKGSIVLMGTPGSGQDFLNFYQKALNLSEKTIELTKSHLKNVLGKDLSYYTANRFAENLFNKGLIVHDLFDKDAPYDSAVSLSQLWKNSKLLTTKGFGHKLKSPKIVTLISDFLQKGTDFIFPENVLEK